MFKLGRVEVEFLEVLFGFEYAAVEYEHDGDFFFSIQYG